MWPVVVTFGAGRADNSPMGPITLDALEQVLAAEDVRSVYQPIVRLDDQTRVGFEALARGPLDSPLEHPEDMFAAARDAGRVGELDLLCMGSAVAGAEGRLAPGQLLF